jgi:hypothetical protein
MDANNKFRFAFIGVDSRLRTSAALKVQPLAQVL